MTNIQKNIFRLPVEPEKSKKGYIYPFLPGSICRALKSTGCYTDDKCKLFCYRLFSMYQFKKVEYFDYIPFDSTLLRLNNIPSKSVNFLIESNIIEPAKFEYTESGKKKIVTYSVKQKKCRHFRFNQVFFDEVNSFDRAEIKAKNFKKNRIGTSFVERKTAEILRNTCTVFITQKELEKELQKEILKNEKFRNEVENKIKWNSEIKRKRIQIVNEKQKKSTAKILSEINNSDFNLFEYTTKKGSRYYLVQQTKDEFLKSIIKRIYDSHFFYLSGVDDQSFHFSKINENNERHNHNLTLLSSHYISKYIRYKNEKLISFDLASSHPTILLNIVSSCIEINANVSKKVEALLKRRFCDEIRLQDIIDFFKTNPDFFNFCYSKFIDKSEILRFVNASLRLFLFSYTLYHFFISNRVGENLAKFKDLLNHIKEGTYYEYLASLFFKKSVSEIARDHRNCKDSKRDSLRDKAKFANMIIFFDDYNAQSKIKAIMKDSVLFLVDLIDEMKRYMYAVNFKSAKNAKEASNLFSVELQKIESKIFVKTIINKLLRKRIIALSKHDSIICLNSNSGFVKEFIINEMKKIFSNNFFLKTEN